MGIMENKHQIFYVNNFDLLRLVTALLVLINHSFVHLQIPVPGWFAFIQPFQPVPMFFVMSGFLISASLERNSNLRQYFTNRFSRIFPGLWVCVLLTMIVFSSLARISFFHAETFPWLLAQSVGFIYTPSFLDQFGYGSYNGSLWTLVVELQFYLILPIIYLAQKHLKIKSNWYFVILFVIAAVLALSLKSSYLPSVASSTVQKLIRYSLPSHAYLFLAGVLLQRFKLYKSAYIRGKALYWAAAFLIFIHIVPPFPQRLIIEMLILATFTVSLAYTLPGLTSKWLGKRDISYGVFLYHGVPLSLLVEWELLGSVWYMAVVGGVSILLAWFSFRFVESPAMDWAKKRNAVLTLKQKNLLPRFNILRFEK